MRIMRIVRIMRIHILWKLSTENWELFLYIPKKHSKPSYLAQETWWCLIKELKTWWNLINKLETWCSLIKELNKHSLIKLYQVSPKNITEFISVPGLPEFNFRMSIIDWFCLNGGWFMANTADYLAAYLAAYLVDYLAAYLVAYLAAYLAVYLAVYMMKCIFELKFFN